MHIADYSSICHQYSILPVLPMYTYCIWYIHMYYCIHATWPVLCIYFIECNVSIRAGKPLQPNYAPLSLPCPWYATRLSGGLLRRVLCASDPRSDAEKVDVSLLIDFDPSDDADFNNLRIWTWSLPETVCSWQPWDSKSNLQFLTQGEVYFCFLSSFGRWNEDCRILITLSLGSQQPPPTHPSQSYGFNAFTGSHPRLPHFCSARGALRVGGLWQGDVDNAQRLLWNNVMS